MLVAAVVAGDAPGGGHVVVPAVHGDPGSWPGWTVDDALEDPLEDAGRVRPARGGAEPDRVSTVHDDPGIAAAGDRHEGLGGIASGIGQDAPIGRGPHGEEGLLAPLDGVGRDDAYDAVLGRTEIGPLGGAGDVRPQPGT